MELFDSLDGGTKDVGVARRLPPALPDEVIFGEILPRLSALDLRRLRSTCKRWNEGIGSPFLRKLWIRKQGFGEVCLVKVSTGGCCAAALYDPGRKRWHPGGLELRLPAGRTKLCVGGGTGDLLCFKVQELNQNIHTFLICDPVTGCCRSLPPLVLASVCQSHELFGAQMAPIPHYPKAYKLVALCRCGRTYAFSSLANGWSGSAALLEPSPVRYHAFPRELEGGCHGLGPCINGAIYTLCGDSAELVAYGVEQEIWASVGSPWGRLGAPRHPPRSQFFLVGCNATLFGVWVRCFVGHPVRLCNFVMAAEIFRLGPNGLKLVGSPSRQFFLPVFDEPYLEDSTTFCPRVAAAGDSIFITGRSSWQPTLVFDSLNESFAWIQSCRANCLRHSQSAGSRRSWATMQNLQLLHAAEWRVMSWTPYAEMEL